MVTTSGSASDEWVFLLHRLPREPSAPRIALWRALRRLGAVLLGDGVVALPADERTIEHMEWLAASIAEAGGNSSVWIARPAVSAAGGQLREQSRAAAESEYTALIAEAAAVAAGLEAERTARRLRRQLRLINQRDFFGAPSASRARAAVEAIVREEVKV